MAVSTFPALRMASTRQKGHSLVRRVRVTICLPMRGWWFFGGSGGFGGRLLQRMVLHAPSPLPVTAFPDAGSVLAYVFGLFVFIFFVHSFPL